MNKKRIKKYLIITLLLIEAFALTLTYKSYENKTLKNVKEEYEINNNIFGMYIETVDTNGNTTYEEYTDSNAFPEGYVINYEKSQCVDTNGNVIDGVLNGTATELTININKTAFCYLYFDKVETLSQLCTNGNNLGSCLISNRNSIDSLDDTAYSGMYRYIGRNDFADENYICFGADSKEVCLNNKDKYMYRIIGITSESNSTLGLEENQVKLIKYTSIGTQQWNDAYFATWDTGATDALLYSYLQNDVLNNTTYFTNEWLNKIDEVKWYVGDIPSESANPETVFEYEKATLTVNTSKLGLIYASDYLYSVNSTGVNSSNGKNCWFSGTSCYSWVTDNDVVDTVRIWTMGRIDFSKAATIAYNGIGDWGVTVSHETHPVFYLNSTEKYASGTGTIDDPIMLGE